MKSVISTVALCLSAPGAQALDVTAAKEVAGDERVLIDDYARSGTRHVSHRYERHVSHPYGECAAHSCQTIVKVRLSENNADAKCTKAKKNFAQLVQNIDSKSVATDGGPLTLKYDPWSAGKGVRLTCKAGRHEIPGDTANDQEAGDCTDPLAESVREIEFRLLSDQVSLNRIMRSGDGAFNEIKLETDNDAKNQANEILKPFTEGACGTVSLQFTTGGTFASSSGITTTVQFGSD